MSAGVRLSDAATRDLAGIFGFLEAGGGDAPQRFERAFETATHRLADHPRIGHAVTLRHARLRGVRSWPVPGFASFLVFHRPEGGTVDILRVLHGARDLESELAGIPRHEEE